MSSTSSNTGEFTYNELMEQYVKATRLIEHLKSQRDRSKRAFDKAMDLVLKYDARIAEFEAAQRWIPVSERLPELDQDVLAIVEGDIVTGHFYQQWDGEIYFSSDDEGAMMVATHWMPQPPEVQE